MNAPAPARQETFELESTATRWRRRVLSLGLYGLLTALWLGLLPLLLPITLVIDTLRRRSLAWTRAVLAAAHYLVCECVGVAVSLALWLAYGLGGDATRERFLAANFRLQWRWAGALFAGLRRLYGMPLHVEGSDALTGPGPVLLFVRHTSLADTVLAAVYVSAPRGLRLRYVMKRELLWDPCLDIVGQRLPNAFVRRGSGDAEREIATVTALARGMGPDDGVLIYPEGTRFTPKARARALARISQGSAHAWRKRAEALTHVLPPRLGGTLALLDACPEADVLFLAHTGLEGTAHARDFLEGALIGQTLSLRLSRVAAAEVPKEREARIAWLYDRWEEIDRWVASHTKAPVPARAPGAEA